MRIPSLDENQISPAQTIDDSPFVTDCCRATGTMDESDRKILDSQLLSM